MLKNQMPIEHILPAGDYATDDRCGFSQLSTVEQNDRDLLKMLECEYMRFIFDHEADEVSSENSNERKMKRAINNEPLCPDSKKTVTDYILGDIRPIDRVLSESLSDDWANDNFFETKKTDIMHLLSPVENKNKISSGLSVSESIAGRGEGLDSCI